MMWVSVVSNTGKPLMPCHPARARELVRKGRAVRRFDRGMFYIRLIDRKDGCVQPVACGIDTGSKREGWSVKSAYHTYLNIQSSTVTWVKDAMKTRRMMRHKRRYRKTPYRACRYNRRTGGLPPSTHARWQLKLRIGIWLSRYYPIAAFIVEDIKAQTKARQRKWNVSFCPLQNGKHWFYEMLGRIAVVDTRRGYETKQLRDELHLRKSSSKLATIFDAHCIDAWVLANGYTGGHSAPDNKDLLCLTPLQFHRRQLHYLQPKSGGIRPPYGGTRSCGLKRGSLVLHPLHGLVYVGGMNEKRHKYKTISIHRLDNGQRISADIKPKDVLFLAYNSWRTSIVKNSDRGRYAKI